MMFGRIQQLAAGLALCIAAFAQPAFAQDDEDARAFAERAIARMQEALPDGRFEMEPGDPLQINVENTPRFDEGVVNLHRVYGYCLSATADECKAELSGLIEMVQEEPPVSGPENLRILVRDAYYMQQILQMLPEEAVPQHRQIGEDLFAILAIDSPETIALAAPEAIADFGLSTDAAWELAEEQTRGAIPPLPNAAMLEEEWHAYEGTEYMASMLFDTAAWSEIAREAGPEMMVTATSDQFVIVGKIGGGEQLEGLKEAAAQDCAAAPRCMSPNVYRFRDGQWVIAE